ncbi:MAG TPA: pirin-like C-terminal cupin domain-containing protein [Kribbellaceae bacterium]
MLVLSGRASVDGTALDSGPLLYLGTGRRVLPIATEGPARLLLLGGEPFAEEIVMWWNFIGRSHDEIVALRNEWNAGLTGGPTDRFGVVRGFTGEPLFAPALPNSTLKPRGRTR